MVEVESERRRMTVAELIWELEAYQRHEIVTLADNGVVVSDRRCIEIPRYEEAL